MAGAGASGALGDPVQEKPGDDLVEALPPKQRARFNRLKWAAFVLTFLSYTSFHLSRKPLSVVANVLHPSSPNGQSTYNATTNPGYPPFNQDLVPQTVALSGLSVAAAGASEYDGVYTCVGNSTVDTVCQTYMLGSGAAAGATIHRVWFTGPPSGHGPRRADICWEIRSPAGELQYYQSRTGPGLAGCPQLPFITSVVDNKYWKTAPGGTGPAPSVQPNLTNGKVLVGVLLTVFLVTYACGLFAAGHIGDQVNLRWFLALGMMGSGIFVAMLGMGYYWKRHTMVFYLAVFGVQGLFQAIGWPSVVGVVGSWWGQRTRGGAMGVWNAHTSCGNILGSLVSVAALGIAMNGNDWPAAFFLPGGIIFTMGLIVLIGLVAHPHRVGLPSPNDRPEAAASSATNAIEVEAGQTTTASEPKQSGCSSFLRALMIPGVIPFAMSLFFAKLVAYTFIYWLPLFLTHIGYATDEAGRLSTFFDLGGIIGGVSAGFLSDKLQMRAVVAWMYLIAAVPGLYFYRMLTVEIGSSSVGLNVICMLVCGAIVNGPYALITTAVSADLGAHKSLKNDAKLLASVTGIIDGTGSAGAALQGVLISWISAHYSWTAVFYALISCSVMSGLLLSRLVFKEFRERCSSKKRSRTREKDSLLSRDADRGIDDVAILGNLSPGAGYYSYGRH